MDALTRITGDSGPQAYATTAAMAVEHLGGLFNFLDSKLGDIAIFDPESPVKEAVVRDAIKVGAKVCAILVKVGPRHGADPAEMRAIWEALVDAAILEDARPPEDPAS